MQTINKQWAPATKTINTLVNKYGYTRTENGKEGQIERLWKVFVQRNWNKQLADASHQYFEFVRKSEVPYKAKKPDNSEDIKQAKERKANFEAKAEDSAERAEEVIEGIHNPQTMKDETMRMIRVRWPHTDWTSAFKRMGLTGDK